MHRMLVCGSLHFKVPLCHTVWHQSSHCCLLCISVWTQQWRWQGEEVVCGASGDTRLYNIWPNCLICSDIWSYPSNNLFYGSLKQSVLIFFQPRATFLKFWLFLSPHLSSALLKFTLINTMKSEQVPHSYIDRQLYVNNSFLFQPYLTSKALFRTLLCDHLAPFM